MTEQRFVDKSKWAEGPWQTEPDKVQWDHAGFDCLIVRGPSGALCGYVGVPPGHPAYEKDYDTVEASVHGGLTFADFCQEDQEHGICHVGGLTEKPWWLGFDCAHAGDHSPAFHFSIAGYETYRDLAYVKTEVEALARQFANA